MTEATEHLREKFMVLVSDGTGPKTVDVLYGLIAMVEAIDRVELPADADEITQILPAARALCAVLVNRIEELPREVEVAAAASIEAALKAWEARP